MTALLNNNRLQGTIELFHLVPLECINDRDSTTSAGVNFTLSMSHMLVIASAQAKATKDEGGIA